MSTLVVKNIPDQLHAQLKRQAERNHRSVTKEVVSLIEAGVVAQKQKLELPPPLKLKSGKTLTIEEIGDAIIDGRYVSFKSQAELNAWMDELRADRDDVPR